MPRTTTTISIFLASPSDVQHERELVAQVISEWNQIHGRTNQVNFELIRWETGIAAGFGSDGQSVINDQSGSYDALIALFWGRIGTATLRADSGSVEEYEIALGRFKRHGDIEISFLFRAVFDQSGSYPHELK